MGFKLSESLKSITILIPGLRTINPLNNLRHWRVAGRQSKMEKHRTTMAIIAQATIPCLPVNVTMIRVSRGTLDDDNLGAAMKHVRDAVADAYGIDDADKRIKFRCEQEKGAYAVKVVIAHREEALPEFSMFTIYPEES